MNFTRLLLFLLLIPSMSLIYSCDDDQHKVWRPVSLRNQDDSMLFVYTDAGRVASVIHHIPITTYIQEEQLEYDDNGKLKRVSFFANNGQLVKLCELTYDDKGYPQKMNVWGSNLSVEPTVTTFYHDTKGRLTKREFTNGIDVTAGIYEYDNDDRLIRFSYQDESDPVVLGREYLSWDNRRRFFGWVSELDILYIYIQGFDPGKTNVLTSRIYANSPLDIYPEPLDLTNVIHYDKKGKVETVVNLTENGTWMYSDIKYEFR